MRRRTEHTFELEPGEVDYDDRVRMNAFGLGRHPAYAGRVGTVVGMPTRSVLRVKFDDRVAVQATHRDYLERA